MRNFFDGGAASIAVFIVVECYLPRRLAVVLCSAIGTRYNTLTYARIHAQDRKYLGQERRNEEGESPRILDGELESWRFAKEQGANYQTVLPTTRWDGFLSFVARGLANVRVFSFFFFFGWTRTR